MFSQAARHLLLRCASAVKVNVKVPARAHSTFNHRAFVRRGMYTYPFPEPAGEERVKAYFLDTRAGIGELIYQVEILKAVSPPLPSAWTSILAIEQRQKRQEILLWICVVSSSVIAAVFVYIALDNELDPPAKELKQKQKEK
ncbi:uncharacterized protein H6S33_011262 [Morchella sextelata]|uniref:uncharacterized protein n=1 Tax=Morchella sextelata TaxID=1174677 RepID=UPI001D04479A|nr:uncharacterized protein H6S33_011262 [Morchella sextelata]KAH0610835.1 hypothetical protein H6S33_011262 [Morchella sextelata]